MSTLEECKTCDYSLKLGNRRKTMNNRLEVNRNKWERIIGMINQSTECDFSQDAFYIRIYK